MAVISEGNVLAPTLFHLIVQVLSHNSVYFTSKRKIGTSEIIKAISLDGTMFRMEHIDLQCLDLDRASTVVCISWRSRQVTLAFSGTDHPVCTLLSLRRQNAQ
jgi:hypothetical protein